MRSHDLRLALPSCRLHPPQSALREGAHHGRGWGRADSLCSGGHAFQIPETLGRVAAIPAEACPSMDTF